MESLRYTGLKVVELFKTVDDTIDKHRYESIKNGFADEANRFKCWAAKHDLFASGNESPDYYLRDARGQDIKETMLKSMRDISGYLQEGNRSKLSVVPIFLMHLAYFLILPRLNVQTLYWLPSLQILKEY